MQTTTTTLQDWRMSDLPRYLTALRHQVTNQDRLDQPDIPFLHAIPFSSYMELYHALAAADNTQVYMRHPASLTLICVARDAEGRLYTLHAESKHTVYVVPQEAMTSELMAWICSTGKQSTKRLSNTKLTNVKVPLIKNSF